MISGTTLLVATAASVGVLHTVLGPDHYLPFVAMARAGSWSRRRALLVTALCGIGHVAGSVILGLIGIAFGLSLSRLEAFESSRGSIAAWGLIVFGLLYAAWGLR
jgi:sulfite exporter TauE/SafE